MATPSNVYAEKVFSEHPIALWTLDEQADFISYFSTTEKDLTTWTKSGTQTGVTVSQYSSPVSPVYPPVNINPTKIVKTFTTSETSTLTFTSTSKSIVGSTVSFYVYCDSTDLSNISIQVGTQTAQVEYISNKTNSWILVSKTFSDASSTSAVTININFNRTTASASVANIYIDSINYAYKSEEFNGVSGGVSVASISDGTLTGYTGLTTYAYGSVPSNGYYISNSSTLFAKNTSMPMVYGASNTTIVYPNTNGTDSSPLPSLVIPGKGFMASYGSNQELTFESWFRINSRTTVFRRIFGPLATTDGLYIKGSFLYLKVGSAMKAHYIGEWFRPMLVQISLSKNGASLFVNGEKIFTITTDLVSAFATNTTQDWLAFYGYSDVPSFEIDVTAIYPYAVSELLAKRRFAYGQAVEYPTSLDAYYGGNSVAIDYSTSNYANNYNYPDIANWSTGISENFNIKQNYMTVPEYQLPDIKISSTSKTVSNLMTDNYAIQSGVSFINLKPNAGWSAINSYIYYSSMSVISSQIASIQIALQSPTVSPTNQTILLLRNKNNGNYISVSIDGTTVTYSSNFSGFGGTAIPFSTISSVTLGSLFSIGFNINTLKNISANYNQFFSIPSQIEVFIGGDGSSTFAGNIYNVGFSTNRNLSKISSYFSSLTGTFISANTNALIAFTSSYTLFLNVLQGYSELDIAVNAYWQDYVPLTAIGKYVTNSSGSQVFGLDSVQFNIDYPDLPIYSGNTYDTSSAILNSYVTLQYIQDGSNKDILDSSFTTSISPSKYGTIDPSSTWSTTKYELVNGTVITMPSNNFTIGKSLSDLALVLHLEANIPGINNSPLKIKYLQLASRALSYGTGNSYGNRINAIGTKFGKPIYPYKTVSGTRDYQIKNQIKIGKTINPYLYLTSQSGIQISGQYDPTVDRGISISINDRQASAYSISSFQLSLLYAQDSFPATPNKIFEIGPIAGSFGKNRFYVVQGNTSSRGRIFSTSVGQQISSVSGTGTLTYTTSQSHNLVVGDVISITGANYSLFEVLVTSTPSATQFVVSGTPSGTIDASTIVEKHSTTDIVMYLNGNVVRNPYLNIREWSTISISYSTFLDMKNSIGEFVITGPVLFNNISYYTIDPTLQGQQLITRAWSSVAASTWTSAKTYSINGLSSWQALALSSINVSYALNPSYIYKIFLGNNKVISDADKKTGIIKLRSYEYRTYLGSQSSYSYFTPA